MFLIIFNKWSHLEDEDWQLSPTRAARKTHTCDVLAVIFSLFWNVQFWPKLDRVLWGWWSMSVCFGSVCDIGFYQLLRLTICFQPLPLRVLESNQSTSCCTLWMSAFLASLPLPDLQPRYFLFNLRLWENTGQSVTTCESPDQSLKKRRQHGANEIKIIQKYSREKTQRGFQLFFETFPIQDCPNSSV